MKNIIIQMAQPLITRGATAISTYLAANGIATETIAAAEGAVYVIAGIALDLTTRYAFKKWS